MYRIGLAGPRRGHVTFTLSMTVSQRRIDLLSDAKSHPKIIK